MADAPILPDDSAAEAEALANAVARARADGASVPHAEVRAWLLRVAAGDTEAAPPVPRRA